MIVNSRSSLLNSHYADVLRRLWLSHSVEPRKFLLSAKTVVYKRWKNARRGPKNTRKEIALHPSFVVGMEWSRIIRRACAVTTLSNLPHVALFI